jgi:hypothetical protein
MASGSLCLMSSDLVRAEWIRETATLVMLCRSGNYCREERTAEALLCPLCLRCLDIVYYGALKLLLDWPASLMTWDPSLPDTRFMAGAVLVSGDNSLTMILMAILFIGRQERADTMSGRVSLTGFNIQRRTCYSLYIPR